MPEVTRSEFLRLANCLLTASGLLLLFGPIVAYFFPSKLEEMPSDPVLLSPEEELPVGESKTIRFGRYPALVIHTPDGFRAYSAVCTHFACIVKWDAASGRIECPCHDGYFDPRDGSVISGPPPSPLEPIAIEVVAGQIYVGGKK